ncbi:TIGR02444 family protein [Variovorax sp.]|uniref:TIGR02444 family protein n=1 Tax=Variovorax sp. TaxID=1871043 RepID=UPI002D374DD8|nr:TIGR02444 family protein [Variovorax sp.]HYP84268.1 TIGR02444 family protein [Variovorax sp.]
MTHDDAWNYIAAAWSRPGAAQDLLRRQDDEGLDVVLHLFARWALDQGRALDDAALREAEALVRPWRDQVVQPLRRLRRALKTMDADAGRRETVRAQLQAAELAAERAQLEQLCDWLAAR